MDLVQLLVALLVIVGIVAVGWWAYTTLTLPPPVRIVLVVVIAILCILFLTQLLPGAHQVVLKL